MQFGKSNFSSVQGTPCAAAVLLQISAVLFANAPSLSAMFLGLDVKYLFIKGRETDFFCRGNLCGEDDYIW